MHAGLSYYQRITAQSDFILARATLFRRLKLVDQFLNFGDYPI